MHWNIIKDDEFGSIKFLKLKYRRGDEINQTFCKIASAQKLSPPLFNFYKSWDSWGKYSWIMKHALKSNEWEIIWLHKAFKIEIQNRGPNNSNILQNCFTPEIRSPLFNFKKFQDSEKSTPASCRMHYNVMNDTEFGSRKPLKLKSRREDQINQTFCKIRSAPETKSPLFNF